MQVTSESLHASALTCRQVSCRLAVHGKGVVHCPCAEDLGSVRRMPEGCHEGMSQPWWKQDWIARCNWFSWHLRRKRMETTTHPAILRILLPRLFGTTPPSNPPPAVSNGKGGVERRRPLHTVSPAHCPKGSRNMIFARRVIKTR